MKSLILLLGFVACSSAFVFGGPEWNNLRVTFGTNPFNGIAFDEMPRDLSSDDRDGWVLKDDYCAQSGPFVGRRYWKENNPSLILIYDVNGYIAGIQTLIPKSQLNLPANRVNNPYVEDGQYWALGGYFIPPSQVCTRGRTPQEYEETGTGTGLHLQLSNNPNHFELIPFSQDDLDANLNGWQKQKCFLGMGRHYWHNLFYEMDCLADFKPFFLLYANGDLRGFGFNFLKVIEQPGTRYETVPPEAASLFLNEVPRCIEGEITTAMHIYFTNQPWFNFC